jgi:hypothetical protein
VPMICPARVCCPMADGFIAANGDQMRIS